jgi:predicted acylesterase/phospholipase RssA
MPEMPEMPENAAEIADLLRSSDTFGDLDDSTIESLAGCLRPVTARAGEVVIAEGDPPGDAYIVVAGRLQATASTEDGRMIVVGELGPGDVLGEMALLTREHRSATVTAVRDTRLLRISDEEFTGLVKTAPDLLLDVTRVVVSRFEKFMHERRRPARVGVVGVIPAGFDPAHHDFAARFAEASPDHRIGVISRDRILSDLGSEPRDWEVTSYLHAVEVDHDLTLLVADEDDSEWSRRCARQADVNLLIGRVDRLDVKGPAEAALDMAGAGYRPPLHLVLMQGGGAPSGTPATLDARAVDRHHHVRLDSDEQLNRLKRVMRGSTVGLVLSGGGARGFAHVGVVKALVEAGVPIDHIGGTSIGASVAAFHAMGLDWRETLDFERRVTVDQGSLVDFTFPAVALGRGDRLTSGIRECFGDLSIEDLWLGYYCVSTNLTKGSARVHSFGPVWSAVRSSVAIPGILPPVRSDDGHLLVDGGVLNNLPTDVMHDLYQPASVIAVDLRASGDLPMADLDGSGIMSGWRVAGRRLAPWKDAMETPRMIDILTHATSVNAGNNAELADFVFRPPVEAFGMLEFKAWKPIFEAGYRYAVDTLESLDEPLTAMVSPQV